MADNCKQLHIQLEIWGRAQHEAARRRKSDWKQVLDSHQLTEPSVLSNISKWTEFLFKPPACKNVSRRHTMLLVPYV